MARDMNGNDIYNKIFDAAVIGCGPAGASLAYFLSKKKLNVLLVEKKRNIDMPVRCAEFVPANIASLFDFKISGINNRTDCMETFICSRKGKVFKLEATTEAPGFILDRQVFTQNLAERFCSMGGLLLKGTKAITINDVDSGALTETRQAKISSAGNCIRCIPDQLFEIGLLKSGNSVPITVKAATVIYSTGPAVPKKIPPEIHPVKNSSSIYEKYEALAGGKERECMYAIAQNLDILPSEPTVNRIFFAPYIYGGYGWVFPKSQSLNIGIGTAFGEGLKDCLETFKRQLIKSGLLHLKKGSSHSKSNNYFKVNTTVPGIAPVSGIISRPAAEEGLVSVGDAAGLCNPVTGAGIYNAVCSAKIAAEKIFLSFQKKDRAILLDINEEYEKMFSVSIGRALKKRHYMLKNWQNSAVPFDEVIKKSWIAFRDYWK